MGDWVYRYIGIGRGARENNTEIERARRAVMPKLYDSLKYHFPFLFLISYFLCSGANYPRKKSSQLSRRTSSVAPLPFPSTFTFTFTFRYFSLSLSLSLLSLSLALAATRDAHCEHPLLNHKRSYYANATP